MGDATPVDPKSPLAKAWDAYKVTDECATSVRWALKVEHPHLQGSLWAIFMAGFEAGQQAQRHPEERGDDT